MEIKHNLQNGYIFTLLSTIFITALGITLWPEPPQKITIPENEFLPHLQKTASLSISPITPVPKPVGLDPEKVALGKKLFTDTRLSADHSISCSSCHQLSKGGADGLPASMGIDNHGTKRNTPTIFNAVLNFRQFWDGRVKSIEKLIDSHLTSDFKMDANWHQIIIRLNSDTDYVSSFKRVYKDGITRTNIKDAIITFGYSLLTPGSDFDDYLRGDTDAIDEKAKDGYRLFISYGCISCHNGVNVGGNIYAKLGVITPYYDETLSSPDSVDLGRYHITKDPSHRYEFKVPGLRNIELTAPYLHDGSIETLDETVKIMARHQLGIEMPASDRQGIVAFLKTLTGKYDGRPL